MGEIAILQRVASATVTVDSQLISSIGKGVLVFAAVDRDDTPKEVESMAAKVLKMKMWPDDDGGLVRYSYLRLMIWVRLLIKDSGSIVSRTSRAKYSVVCEAVG